MPGTPRTWTVGPLVVTLPSTWVIARRVSRVSVGRESEELREWRDASGTCLELCLWCPRPLHDGGAMQSVEEWAATIAECPARVSRTSMFEGRSREVVVAFFTLPSPAAQARVTIEPPIPRTDADALLAGFRRHAARDDATAVPTLVMARTRSARDGVRYDPFGDGREIVVRRGALGQRAGDAISARTTRVRGRDVQLDRWREPAIRHARWLPPEWERAAMPALHVDIPREPAGFTPAEVDTILGACIDGGRTLAPRDWWRWFGGP